MEKRDISVPSVPLLPQLFWSPWDDYDAEEREQHAHLERVDRGGLLLLAMLYAGMAWVIAPLMELPEVPTHILAVQLLLTIVALYNLYAKIWAVPKPMKTLVDNFNVGKGPIGRWIWLTHQTLGLIAVHFVFSLVAPLFSTRLALGTYRLSMLVGALGVFVTIQFFALVFPTSTYISDCRAWSARGVHEWFVSPFLHLPPLVLAAFDVCLLKHRGALLLAMPSVLTTMLVFVAYCIIYVSVLHANHALTGFWPYGLCLKLGKSPAKWAQFMVVQCSILCFFSLILRVLASFTWALW